MIINPYLNFEGNAEEAFRFYHSIFGGSFFIQKMNEIPGMEHLPENEKNSVMHVSVQIGDKQHLMGSDCLPSQGHKLHKGNNNYISITTDTREEAERLFQSLSKGGIIEMPLQDMFWGDYFGSFKDQFGVHWMISFPSQLAE